MNNSSNTILALGNVLRDDLAKVLDKSYGHKGSFAHSESQRDAPNPFLAIMNIGPIDLPLSEIDAKRIIACATQAPFGLGTSTIIDKEVRDTWQIDPSLISFQNPAWESFLQSNIGYISRSLGLPCGYDIRYKLHKLLLYETGSHFRPHQDTQKEDGMFATMIIVLPSRYTGGEIIVSHGSITKVIDISASCMTSTSVLSWYTDVVHEVKPITSGYRLVLSYNLMRRSVSGLAVIPTADNTSVLNRLYAILERWCIGGYKRIPKQHMVALVLEHQYSQSDLDMGQAALKGQDAHKVDQIRLVAERLGFELWLAKCERYITSEVEAEDDRSDGIIESGEPGDTIEDRCTLEYFVDLKGNRVPGEIKDFDVEGLIMERHYPDDENFNVGFRGNEPASIEYYYHRAALVIFHKEDMDRFMIITRGAGYGLDMLQDSLSQDGPTAENRKIADLLLEYDTITESIWKDVATLSLRYHDHDLWGRTIEHSVKRHLLRLDLLKEEIFLAWDVFGFQQIRSSYESIICGVRHSGDKINFIHQVKARAADFEEQEVIEAWCDEQIVRSLKGFDGRNDVGRILVSIAKEDGIKFLKVFERYHSCGYDMKEVIKLFMSEKENIYASPPNQPGSSSGEDLNQIFNDFLDKCFRYFIPLLDNYSFLGGIETTCSRRRRQDRITRILEVVELCITADRIDECATIFQFIWNVRGDASKKLMRFYIPFTRCLSARLQHLGTSLLVPPFATFAQNVIGYYLSQMLGSKTHIPRSSLPKLSCNQSCSICTQLRQFFEQFYVPHQDFCVSKKTRKHFNTVLIQLSKIVSVTKLKEGRYRLNKRRDFLHSSRWEYRLEQARNLLKSIGDDDFIEELMGDKFEELKVALKGNCIYNYTGSLPRHDDIKNDTAASDTEDDMGDDT